MADTELNFSHRWIDLEALYRHRIPLRKIFVPLGAWSPQPNFRKFDPEIFPEIKTSYNFVCR